MRIEADYRAVLLSAAAAMLASAVYYTVLGNAWLTLRGIDPGSASATPSGWEIAGQLARNLVVAFVLAYLLRRLEAATWKDAVRVELLLWFGFEAMAVVGAVLHEGYPLGLYAIHVGDALMATLIMALVLSIRRGEPRRSRGSRVLAISETTMPLPDPALAPRAPVGLRLPAPPGRGDHIRRGQPGRDHQARQAAVLRA
jgi:hypothetical protein